MIEEKIENVIYKLEEKVMTLVAENEKLRREVQDSQLVRAENTTLKQEKDSNTRKLQDLLSLLDSANPIAVDQNAYAFAAKPALVQA